MKKWVIIAVLAAFMFTPLGIVVHAQFAPPPDTTAKPGGPVAIGQVMAQPDPANPAKVTILQAPTLPAEQGGGLIQLKVFGWLEPYADALAQALIAAGFAWFMKSKYSTMLDETSRNALETFAKNRASSLIADGFVKMDGKTVDVHSAALGNEAAKAATMIPDALKRFGLTPDVVAAKIVDAIPQVAAGAAMVASAHSSVVKVGDIMVAGNVDNMKAGPGPDPNLPPTSPVQL